MESQATQSAQQRLEGLLSQLGFAVDITSEQRDDRTILHIDLPQHAILIGKGGETLRALQHILNVIQKKADEPFVTIDIADYHKGREERLQAIAVEAADRARATNNQVHLKPMNAYERRQVHMTLADMPDIITTSEGEDPHRTIVVQLRPE